MKTANEFKEHIQAKGITELFILGCSMCNYPLKYIFKDGNAFVDTGCYCTRTQVVSPRSWETIAGQYNEAIKRNPVAEKQWNAFWKFVVIIFAIALSSCSAPRCAAYANYYRKHETKLETKTNVQSVTGWYRDRKGRVYMKK